MNSSILNYSTLNQKHHDIRLMILIPCTGKMEDGLIKFLRHIERTAPFQLYWDTHYGRPVDDCRNGIVRRFLDDPARYTHLMQIDSDVIPPPNTLEMILHDKFIVSAVVLTWTDGLPLALLMKWDEAEQGYKQDKEAINQINSGERLVQIDASGAGCFVVKRAVYENMVTNWFRFQYSEQGNVIMGEDFVFYKKAKEMGYSVWVDGAIKCGHIGNINILEVQNALAKSPGG